MHYTQVRTWPSNRRTARTVTVSRIQRLESWEPNRSDSDCDTSITMATDFRVPSNSAWCLIISCTRPPASRTRYTRPPARTSHVVVVHSKDCDYRYWQNERSFPMSHARGPHCFHAQRDTRVAAPRSLSEKPLIVFMTVSCQTGGCLTCELSYRRWIYWDYRERFNW